MIKNLLNPIYLISIQVIFYIVTVFKYKYIDNYKNTIIIALVSYLLFIALVFIVKSIYKCKKESKAKLIINKETYLLLNIINIIIIASISITILKITGMYGGITGFIHNYNFSVIRDIQSSLGNLGSYALVLSYINPLVITIIFIEINMVNSKLLKNIIKILLYINLIIIFIFSMVIGARITFIYSLMTLLIVKFKDMKINLKSTRYITIGVLVLVSFVLISQSTRNRNMGESEISDISPIVMITNYYDKSIKNSVYVISNEDNAANAKGYWSVKTLFNIPKIGPIISDIYTNYIGDVIIKNRGDEFSYVSSLGLNPVYNTMGIYGYQYLDWGIFSIFTIAIQFLISYLVFFRFKLNMKESRILYPIIFISFIDLLRTNGLSSSFVIYYIVFYVLLKTFDCLLTNYKYRTGMIKGGKR